jgi:hypothetical protein
MKSTVKRLFSAYIVVGILTISYPTLLAISELFRGRRMRDERRQGSGLVGNLASLLVDHAASGARVN